LSAAAEGVYCRLYELEWAAKDFSDAQRLRMRQVEAGTELDVLNSGNCADRDSHSNRKGRKRTS
jgi:hypothetical protein